MTTTGYVSLMTGVGAISAALVVAAVVLATPTAIGPVGVTLWFLALLAAATCGLGLLFYGLSGRLQSDTPANQRVLPSWRRGLLIGGWLTLVLALSSLHQLGVRDVVLTALFVVIVEFYFQMKA